MAVQVLSLVALAVGMLVLWLLLLRWRYRRATNQVLSAFRRHGALSPQSARTLPELGIRPPPLIGLRDYRVVVLQAMVSAGIIRVADSDRYYLYEQHLPPLKQPGKPG